VNPLRPLLAIARADFTERVRRTSFLVTLAAAAWLGWLVIDGHVSLSAGGYHGVMNGAWAGMLVAGTTSMMVSLVGFWVVKNAVERDRATRVGEILAATPLTKVQYTLGKFLSNLGVLGTIVGALMLVVPVLVALKGEHADFALVPMVVPFLLIALPGIAVVGALAVFFETFRPLSGGAGNVLWFFLWSALLAVPMSTGATSFDMSGMAVMKASTEEGARAAFPDTYTDDFSFSIGGGDAGPDRGTFVWRGIQWTPARLAQRCSWFVVALGIALLAAVPFDRFDTSHGKRGRAAPAVVAVETARAAAEVQPAHLTPLPASRRQSPFAVYLGELGLMVKGRPWWFWAVCCGLFVAELTLPLEIARGRILPFAWIWPILLWSAMGAREAKDGTEELVFTAPRPVVTQIPALYLAGVTVALAAGGGIAVRCLLAGSGGALAGWLAGALFIPALALCLGVWSGTSKAFEALYTVLWYVGPLQPVAGLDFMGASDAALAAGTPAVTAAAAVMLVALAALGRRLRLAR
jgi:hypothetical protein